MSNNARTLAWCRAQGMDAQVVEHWNAHARKRLDLFNCLDVVALDDKPGVLGIQTTSRAHVSARVKKILDEPRAHRWLKNGNRIVVHGWDQPGGPRHRWRLKEVDVKPEAQA